MLAKLKLIIGVGVAGVIGFLYAALRVEKSEKKQAEANAAQYKQAADETVKTVEVMKDVQNAKAAIDSSSNDNVVSLLGKYDRSRKS